MIQAACINRPSPLPALQPGTAAKPERIVIIIEAGKIVWYDTTGKLPPETPYCQRPAEPAIPAEVRQDSGSADRLLRLSAGLKQPKP